MKLLIPEAVEAGDDPWVELAGFGEPSVSTEPGEIDATLYGE